MTAETGDASHAESYAGGRSAFSEQAMKLYAMALESAIRLGTGDLIGRAEADRLAEMCGALVEELVDTGFWIASDLSYRIRAGTVTTIALRYRQ